MGIIVNKEDDINSDLASRINADLREKLETTSTLESDLAENSEYTKDLHETSRFGWVWGVLIFLAIISLIFILF